MPTKSLITSVTVAGLERGKLRLAGETGPGGAQEDFAVELFVTEKDEIVGIITTLDMLKVLAD